MRSESGRVVRAVGALDAEGCARLRDAVSSALAAGVSNLVLDFSEVTRVERPSVDLLRGLEGHLRSQLGALAIIRPSAPALKGLKINGLTGLLKMGDLLPRPLSPPKRVLLPTPAGRRR